MVMKALQPRNDYPVTADRHRSRGELSEGDEMKRAVQEAHR